MLLEPDLADKMKTLIIEGLTTKSDFKSVHSHIKEALEASEDGNWVARVWYDGTRTGLFWSHQRAKFSFERDDFMYNVSVAQMSINRDKVKNCSSKLPTCTSLRLCLLPEN